MQTVTKRELDSGCKILYKYSIYIVAINLCNIYIYINLYNIYINIVFRGYRILYQTK